MYPEDLSNCGCAGEPTTPAVTVPAPPVCVDGEQCPEVINTACVRYDGPDIPGIATTGDNMNDVVQNLSTNSGGGGGGANNFILQPVDTTIELNGASDPVTVDQTGQVITISAAGAKGDKGDKGDPGTSVTVEGYTSTYATLLTDFPAPAPLTVVMLTDEVSGVNGTIYVYDPTSTAADGNDWVNLGQISGPKGDTGDDGETPVIGIGSTTTGLAGTQAQVTVTGTPLNPLLNFTIPQGNNGSPGSVILSGTTAPTGGNNGDYYLNTTTKTLFGPKAGGAWPTTGLLLKGSDGSDGSDGANSSTGVAGFRDLGSSVTTWTLKADAPVGTATPGGTDTTPDTTDAGIVVLTSNAAANTIRVPIDLNNFPVGHQVTIMQGGTGQVRILPVDSSGVSIDSANGMTYLRTQFSAATLVKRSNTKWYMFGDLTNVVV